MNPYRVSPLRVISDGYQFFLKTLLVRVLERHLSYRVIHVKKIKAHCVIFVVKDIKNPYNYLLKNGNF